MEEAAISAEVLRKETQVPECFRDAMKTEEASKFNRACIDELDEMKFYVSKKS